MTSPLSPASQTAAVSPADWMSLWLAVIRARVGVALARAAGADAGLALATLASLEAALEARRAGAAAVPATWLRTRLGLTATEECVVWLLVACELADDIRAQVLALGDGRAQDVSLSIIERVAYGEDGALLAWRELAEGAPLQRLRLVVRTDADALAPAYRQLVRADRRLRGLMLGDGAVSPALAELATLVERAPTLDELTLAAADRARIAAAVAAPAPWVMVTGPSGSGRASALRAAALACGRRAIDVDARALATTPAELTAELRTLVREALLVDAVLMLRHLDAFGAGQPNAAHAGLADRELARATSLGVLATAGARVTGIRGARPVCVIELAEPGGAELAGAWRRAVPGAAAALVDELAALYPLAPAVIHAVGTHLARHAPGAPTLDDVRDTIGVVVDDRLAGLASPVRVTQTWDDLSLPRDQLAHLIELVARVRGRRTVHEAWGFGAKVGRGLGVTALLSGPPGTGKTMVAGLLARELGLPLYRVEIPQMVSKWLGETEKNLAALFDAAESTRAILLFDEADALFGKRTEVKSSNDRYANLEVNYLLQRLETFTGVCLLTSNHESALDEAFRRRLACHVRFAMPDEEERARLWRLMLPARAPVADDVDLSELAARIEMSGGHIRNAVLRAAFLAADEGRPIGMPHLTYAARVECEAMGKIAPAGLGYVRA